MMKFYIVTPTFNALEWLQCCVRSVADQAGEGVVVHHHVQDGGSGDGTVAWLEQWRAEHEDVTGYTFTYESGRDSGMYDALNRAWAKLPEDAAVTAHLNSDEQYLPGALQEVAQGFRRFPKAEVLACAFLIVDAQGRYICHRRPVQPRRWRSEVVCELNTCSCFHEAAAFRRHGIRFDTRYRSIADLVMYREMVRIGVRVVILPQLLSSSFAVTGSNLAWTEVTGRELVMAAEGSARWQVCGRRWINLLSNVGRRWNDFFCKAPQKFALYARDSAVRAHKRIRHATAHWGMRSEAVDEE